MQTVILMYGIVDNKVLLDSTGNCSVSCDKP